MEYVASPDPLLVDLRKELMPSERLIWSARPVAGRFGLKYFRIWLFAVPWTAFALFWTAMAYAGVSSDQDATLLSYAFPLFGLPFVAVGLGMLGSPFWIGRAGQRTIYGITDARIITLTRLAGLRVSSVDARQIGPIRRAEQKDGLGSLTIETHSTRDSDGDWRTESVDISDVADVRHVERLVRELAAA